MKKFFALCVMTGFWLLYSASPGFAAGFRIPDQDSAALGMGGAFAGQADNPSAAWYNPAGMTQLDGIHVSAGVIAIAPDMKHVNTGTSDESRQQVFFPVQLFATDRLNDKIALGLGITSPFGLATDWSQTSATSTVATLSKIETLDINPDIAYKINESLSIAVGLDYFILKATMEKMLGPGTVFSLNGDGTGLGANAAMRYSATDRLHLGLSYRSKVKIKVDGTADVDALALSNPAHTNITLPDLYEFGASYKASDALTLNADVDYTLWSTYDKVVITSNTILALTTPTGSPTDTSTSDKDWKNTWTFRVGGQYKLTDAWKLRAGYVYDQNPVPDNRLDTSVPDADRQGVTVGCGYVSGSVSVDAAYMYLAFKNRVVTNSLAGGSAPVASLNGEYKAHAHLAGITVAYAF